MNLTIFCLLLNKCYVCNIIVYRCANQILPQSFTEQSDTLFHSVDTLNTCMKKSDAS